MKNLSLMLAVFTLVGCGGDSHSASSTTGAPSTQASSLVGSWSGTYQAVSGDQSGTISISIVREASGTRSGVRVTGTARDSKYGTATVTGFVYDHDYPLGGSEGPGGLLNGYVSLSGIGLAYASGGDDFFDGIPALDARGHLVALLGLVAGSDIYPRYSFDLAPAAAQ